MVYVCAKGCLTDGRPTKHANEGACPVIRAERKANRTPTVPERRTDPEPKPDGSTTPPKPPAPEKGAWEKFVEFIREPATTVASPEVPTKQESYLLEGDDIVRFVQMLLSFGELILNLF